MSALAEYVDNPLLGEEWDPLVSCFELLLDVALRERPLSLQTHTHRHGLRPSSSPYVQFKSNGTGGLVVEVSGNLLVKPELDDMDVAQLEFFGWQPPETSAEDYRNGDGGNPNFWRDFDGVELKAIAAWIVTTLVVVYRLETRDFFGIEVPYVVTRLAEAHLLDRLSPTQSNPFGYIFCMPGQHADMTQPSS